MQLAEPEVNFLFNILSFRASKIFWTFYTSLIDQFNVAKTENENTGSVQSLKKAITPESPAALTKTEY